jgi:VanZ family protein
VTKFLMLTRIGAGLAVLTIIVLSVVPGNMRPDVLENDFYEHFAAYFITASLLAVGYPRPMQLLSSGVLLAICAGSLEFVQLWIPGRTASVRDFAAGAAGAWIALLIVVVRRARERTPRFTNEPETALQNCDRQGGPRKLETDDVLGPGAQ